MTQRPRTDGPDEDSRGWRGSRRAHVTLPFRGDLWSLPGLSAAPSEKGVHCGYHHRSFSDSRGHPLDRAGADVADGQYPGHRDLDRSVVRHEALVVEFDAHAV